MYTSLTRTAQSPVPNFWMKLQVENFRLYFSSLQVSDLSTKRQFICTSSPTLYTRTYSTTVRQERDNYRKGEVGEPTAVTSRTDEVTPGRPWEFSLPGKLDCGCVRHTNSQPFLSVP